MRNRFVAYCRQHLDFSVRDYQYFQSFSLCCLEASFNANTRFAAVQNVLMHFCEWTTNNGLPLTDETRPELWRVDKQIQLSQVLQLIDNQTLESLADIVGNHQRVAGRLKAELFLDMMHLFSHYQIETYQDFQGQFNNLELEEALSGLRGVGAATMSYLYLLAGGQNDVKIDRHIRSFAETATRVVGLSDQQILDLFVYAAQALGLTVRHLDHIVWEYQSNCNKKNK